MRTAEESRLRDVILALLDLYERRCDECDQPIAHRRDKVILVSKPNAWCEAHKPDWTVARTVPDDHQPKGVVLMRAALAPSDPQETKR